MTEATGMSKGRAWLVMICAATILMLTYGARQTTGLFISSINTSTGLGIVAISLAMAIAQFTWGVAQPIFGALADRFGTVAIVTIGVILLALGNGLTPFMHSQLGLILTLGILSASGSGAASFSILIGASSQHLPPERRAFAAGFINAGGSFGQAVFALLSRFFIESFGWVASMIAVGACTLLSIPLALPLREKRRIDGGAPGIDAPPGAKPAATVQDGKTLGQQVRESLHHRSYLLLHAGFFTCGFHIAFLVTHLPGEVRLCGLPGSVAATSLSLIGLFNIAGSLTAGTLGSRMRLKTILSSMYAARAVIILIYLFAPKTALTFYIFAAALGFTWLATIPPTAGLVGKFFGVRHLGTLFGLTLVTHQVGAFLGAYLGGLAVQHFGNYTWMWYADAALALAAALINMPISEAPVIRKPVPA